MDRIFLSGDTHGETDIYKVLEFFEDLVLYDEVTKEDYLIILGDAGVVWDEGIYDSSVRQSLSSLPVTILWLDGNHENFNLLEDYPETIWHGGRVQYIEEDIIHLMRGQVFEIGGKTFFTFGGGNSIDKMYRTPRISWWEQEMPSEDEYEEGMRNLEKVNFSVDYILTHTCPTDIAHQLVYNVYEGEEPLQEYLQSVAEKTDFDEWYFGHWHMDEDIDRFHCLWNNVFELEY